MADAKLTELAVKIEGVSGRLTALINTFSDHRLENHEDHKAVMAVLERMESKVDNKFEGHDGRIKDLEKFKSHAYGLAAAVTFFISAPHIAQLIIP